MQLFYAAIIAKTKTKKYIPMKKNLFLLFALAIAFASCTKEESNVAPANNESAQKAIVPILQFTKKVLVEEFVGCSYGNAPYSSYTLNSITTNSSNRVCVASMHVNDIMQLGSNMPLISSFTNSSTLSIPCALVDRTGSSGSRVLSWSQYNSRIQQMLNQTAPCGLALNTRMNGNIVNVDVSTKFNASFAPTCNVSVYMVHETVNSALNYYGQSNAFNSVPGNPFSGKGNPILPYNHQNVLFKVMSNANAGKVNTSTQVMGGIDMQKFTCEISPTQVGSDCYIIAFITNSVTREVLNVQKVKLGMSQTWD